MRILLLACAALWLLNTPASAEYFGMQEGKVIRLSPSEARTVVSQGGDKPVMMVVYASWCGYCRRYVPSVLQMAYAGSLAQVTPVYISIDENTHDLDRYLTAAGYYAYFTPYRVEGVEALVVALQGTGSRFTGSVPYTAFFGRNGQLLGEMKGAVDNETVLQVAGEVAKNNLR